MIKNKKTFLFIFDANLLFYRPKVNHLLVLEVELEGPNLPNFSIKIVWQVVKIKKKEVVANE
jgi:hypothetical protein